jgi:hypothetical protein
LGFDRPVSSQAAAATECDTMRQVSLFSHARAPGSRPKTGRRFDAVPGRTSHQLHHLV